MYKCTNASASRKTHGSQIDGNVKSERRRARQREKQRSRGAEMAISEEKTEVRWLAD
jgi:hypothetical protein